MSLFLYIMQTNSVIMDVLLFTAATPVSHFYLHVLGLVQRPNLHYNVSILQAFAWTMK